MAIRDNDLTSIVKYGDDTTLLVKVRNNEIDLSQDIVNQFFSGTQDNAMVCIKSHKMQWTDTLQEGCSWYRPCEQYNTSFFFKSVRGYLTK